MTHHDGASVEPYEIQLFDELDVAIVDTLEDVDAPEAARHAPDNDDSPDELHEQRLSSMIA